MTEFKGCSTTDCAYAECKCHALYSRLSHLSAVNENQKQIIRMFRDGLVKFANEDYRGNRPAHTSEALRLLKLADEMGEK